MKKSTPASMEHLVNTIRSLHENWIIADRRNRFAGKTMLVDMSHEDMSVGMRTRLYQSICECVASFMKNEFDIENEDSATPPIIKISTGNLGVIEFDNEQILNFTKDEESDDESDEDSRATKTEPPSKKRKQ